MKHLLYLLLFSAALLNTGGPSARNDQGSLKARQDSLQALLTEKLIEGGSYAFNAERIGPTSTYNSARSAGGTGYCLAVSPRKVVSQLPYYGSVRFAQTGGETSSLFFTVSNPDPPRVTRGKNGGWTVEYRLYANRSVYRYILDVKPNGDAVLTVNPAGRESQSFYGTVSAIGGREP